MITYWAGFSVFFAFFPSSNLFPLSVPEGERERGQKRQRGNEMRMRDARKDKLTREKMIRLLVAGSVHSSGPKY